MESWMSKIPDQTKLNQMSIPGTHDTMTAHAEDGFFTLCKGPWGQVYCLTQEWKLLEQLRNGIRFIDIRISQDTTDPRKFWIYHGRAFLDVTLKEVLDILAIFLTDQPTETVIYLIFSYFIRIIFGYSKK